MPEVFFVFLGGGIGSLLRYFMSKIFSSIIPLFPFATLVSNISGAFILGFVFVFYSSKFLSGNSYLFFAVGICGGFSTFSTFTLDSLQLFQQGNISGGVLNIILNLVCCFVSIITGMFVAKLF